MHTKTLKVDLADPDDVRAKLPQARKLEADARDEARRANDAAGHWTRLVAVLEGIAGPDETYAAADADEPDRDAEAQETSVRSEATKKPRSSGVNGTDMILDVMRAADAPQYWRDIAAVVPQLKPSTVAWNLSNMERDGLVTRVQRGVYEIASGGMNGSAGLIAPAREPTIKLDFAGERPTARRAILLLLKRDDPLKVWSSAEIIDALESAGQFRGGNNQAKASVRKTLSNMVMDGDLDKLDRNAYRLPGGQQTLHAVGG